MSTPKPPKKGTPPLPEPLEGEGTLPKRTRRSGGKSKRAEESAIDLPRIRTIFAVFKRNQDHPRPDKRFPTLKELGALLDPERPLGENAVRRVLDIMRWDFGMPVNYVPERGGHGFTEPVAGFPLDAISEEQVYYLIQSVQMLALHRNAKAYAELRRVVKKACLGITLALGMEFEEIEQALSFYVIGFDAPAPVDPTLFKAVMRAVLRRREVRVEHRSAKRPGEVTVRTVEPLHVSMINHALYLWHYDPALAGQAKGAPAADGVRKFALTRIAQFAETGRGCRTRDFDIAERLKHGMGAFDEPEAVRVRLRVSAKMAPFIVERQWHPTQEIERLPEGGIELRLRVAVTPDLEAFVLRWAGHIEVLEPSTLRSTMRELGAALAAAHEG